MNVYPNPVSDDFVVDLQLQEEGDVNIRVYDAIGQEVYRQSQFLQAGVNILQLSSVDWVAGTYVIQVLGPNNFNEVRQILKVMQ